MTGRQPEPHLASPFEAFSVGFAPAGVKLLGRGSMVRTRCRPSEIQFASCVEATYFWSHSSAGLSVPFLRTR